MPGGQKRPNLGAPFNQGLKVICQSRGGSREEKCHDPNDLLQSLLVMIIALEVRCQLTTSAQQI